MIIISGLIGSSTWDWFHGTKAECKKWDEKRAKKCQRHHGGVWFNVYSPCRIISDREARKIRYRDGSKVFDLD